MAQDGITELDEIIVIGCSAGDHEALLGLLPQLKPDFNTPIVIVQHGDDGGAARLLELLATKTKIKVKEAEEKELITAGNLYIAPAAYHLLFAKDGSFALKKSEDVNNKSNIDIAFSAAADVYASSVIGVLLSGGHMDGLEGFEDIKDNGGVTIIQQLETAVVSNDAIDMVLTTDGIAAYLNAL